LELLDDRQKYICSRIFRTITLRTDGGHEIRKPESVSAIAAQIGCSADEIIQVAEVFRAQNTPFLLLREKFHLMNKVLLTSHMRA
jgi:hypothetical protein